jgi:endonuclease/exonuclease/phosphatase family metal-dependent hydrolase
VPDTGLRLLTWNVRDMLGDPLAVHRVLRAAQADLVCLQESPRWPGSRWQLRRLAAASGLSYLAGGRASAGTSVLIGPRARTDSAQALTLPVATWRTRPRGAVIVSVAVPGRPGAPVLTVACLHLGLAAAERAHHVGLLTQLLTGRGRLVLAGDLNEGPGSASWTGLAALAADPAPDAGPTFPSWDPRRRIDAVLVSPGVQVLEYDAWRPAERDLTLASDHRPVLAIVAPR